VFSEDRVRLLSFLGFVVVGVGVWAYVALRSSAARRRGEDVHAARWSALGDALPVAGAGLAGVFIFTFALGLIGFVFVISVLDGSVFVDPERVASLLEWILVVGTAALVGLPLVAVSVVVCVRRWRRRGQQKR